MDTDIRALQVTRAIVHDVPSRIGQGYTSGVTYSEVESQLDRQSKNYFRERTIGSLQSAGFDVRFATEASSPVPNLLSEYLIGRDIDDFVEMSKQIAVHLYNSQTGVNSPGLLCLLEIRIGEIKGITILKLNREGAVRIEPTEWNGSPTYNLHVIRDLILSERSKVFKAGLFLPVLLSEDLIEIRGRVSDNQRGYAPAVQVADFFLKRFLGCELLKSAQSITKQFFDVTEEWIAQIPDPVLKAQYETALLAELNNERGIVNPFDFADTNLHLDDRRAYKDWLSEREIDFRPFEKDTQLIKNRLRRISVDFESGIGVFVPTEAMEKGYVKISEGRNELTRMEIEDRLRTLRGR